VVGRKGERKRGLRKANCSACWMFSLSLNSIQGALLAMETYVYKQMKIDNKQK
jgi:hypothetical protein